MSTAFAAIGYTGFKASEDRQSFSISLYGGFTRNLYYLGYYDRDNNLKKQIPLCRAPVASSWCKATIRYNQLPKFNQGDYIVFLNRFKTGGKISSPKYDASLFKQPDPVIGYTNFKVSEDRQSFSISLYGGFTRNLYYLGYYDRDNNLKKRIPLCQAPATSSWCRATIRYDQLPNYNKGDYIVFLNLFKIGEAISSPKYDAMLFKKMKECKLTPGTKNFTEVTCNHLNVEYFKKIENFKVISEETIPSLVDQGDYYTGYSDADITVSYENNHLTIVNNSPRKFADITFYSNNQAYLIDYNVPPFSKIIIQIEDDLNLTDGVKDFLDPSPAYRTHVSRFGKYMRKVRQKDGSYQFPVDSEAQLRFFKNYGLMISHLRNYYAQNSTKENFFYYFMGKYSRHESLDSALSKWYKTNTHNLPVVYLIYHSSDPGVAGSASPYELALNYAMDRFDKNKKDTFSYRIYVHERAHTMGYSHSSGLTHGWDRYTSNIALLWKHVPADQPVSEHSNVYLYYDKNTDKIYAYSRSDTIKYINSVSFIYPTNKNLSISTNGDEIQIQSDQIQHNGDYTPVPSILISAKSDGDQKNYNLITPAKFSIDFKAFNNKGVEINTFPSSGPAIFKITSGDIPIKNQTFEVQYEKFYVYPGEWKWIKLGDCMIESGHSINCTVQDSGSKESRPYRYRVIRKSDGKVISKTITLDN